jgi:effector-binding domain-containing protein
VTHKVEEGVESERPTAVAKGRASFEDLPKEIQRLIDVVYEGLKKAGVSRTGKNIVLYDDHSDEMEIEVGVEVSEPIEANERVVPSVLPSGAVAKTLHTGSYADLHKAHRAIQDWCEDNDQKLAGPNWEIYGHWSDDESKLETDVYYLLR